MTTTPSSGEPPSVAQVIAETRAWVDRAVIGLNLCPFAKAVQVRGQVRYVVSEARTETELLAALVTELHRLADVEAEQIDTTLLIHPRMLDDFEDFNDFLGAAESVVEDLGYDGVFQVASFHPAYRFEGTDPDDIGNATNRSPYPVLHLLREESIDRAVLAVPDPEAIYENNLRTLDALGHSGWSELQEQCRKDAEGAQDAGTDPPPSR